MAVRVRLGTDVFNEAIERLAVLMEAGHRLVVSFSAGKDSGVCLELAILAARAAGALPVDVILRDEEIMLPGTFEYAERVAQRPEVRFRWVYANQPIINLFNRALPYFWVFDPLLAPDDWVRQPPAFAERIPDQNIERMTIPARFPPPENKALMAVIGLRTDESRNRLYGLFSSGGYVTKPNREGVRSVRPIYDWTDSDVWRAVQTNGWDYNRAYDTLFRMGVPNRRLRIAPPTMNPAGIETLAVAARAWPQWFDRVASRLPGVRMAVNFGPRAVTPQRRYGESWEACFQRTCITEAPAWIATRAGLARERYLHTHTRHSTTPFPEIEPCPSCGGNVGSWRQLARAVWGGDPFAMKTSLPLIEPEFFRAGAGTWGGSPSWA